VFLVEIVWIDESRQTHVSSLTRSEASLNCAEALISASGSHEFIYETIVDIDFGSLCRVPEFSAEAAARVSTRDNHHVIL